jgi:pyruvate dehydrogenase E2 component (dihydrolipoamide acetyltransferase)
MAIALKLPPLSKGMSTGEISQWLKSPGDCVHQGEPIVEVLSEKANVEVESPSEGVLLQVLVHAGQEVPVGTVLCWIGMPGEIIEDVPEATAARISQSSSSAAVSESRPRDSSSPSQGVKATPLARRMASEHNIGLTDLQGSGPGGLITDKDIDRLLEQRSFPGANADRGQPDDVERVPLRGIRKVMSARMTASKQTTAAATTIVDVDMEASRALKAQLSITYTAIVVKAAAMAMEQHPIVNAFLERDEIVFHKRKHVGVAVDTPQGLRVLTVPDANRKPLPQVNEELRRLAHALRDGAPLHKTEDVSTFTVSNSGVLGSLLFTPLINPPESACLGMGRIHDAAVVREGKIVIRPMMYLCLTYDHRLIEGAEAVRFLQSVKERLENPKLLT